ncbi:MAG: hypothetical protein ACJAVK_000565 [Akkermansiaceae bacterium]|jgi:hypothetical protein
MVAKWQMMSREVLHSERLANPKITPPKSPRTNREWTPYSDSVEPPKSAPPRRRRKSEPASPRPIRARKNTTLNRDGKALTLTFTGEDPGIAMDLRNTPDLPKGPYFLTFNLTTSLQGTGELFFTTAQKTLLSKRTRVAFPVKSTPDTQEFSLEIKTPEKLCQLRLDVADGPGEATIENLKLGPNKKTLITWITPPKGSLIK